MSLAGNVSSFATRVGTEIKALWTAVNGKAPSTRTITAGSGLTGGGDLTADRTISASFAASASALGSSTGGSASTLSRGDHVHAMPSASDVGAVAVSLVDAKGDLFTATANDTPARLAVGSTNGHRLEVASGEATGLKWAPDPVCIAIAVSDETTNITTGTAKVTFRMPWAMTVTAVRASLATASTSGNPTFDINEGGTSILGTNKLSIDANEKTSTTAATATTISDSALADDAEITIDIDTAGTGAKGAKVYLIGTRA